MFANLKPNKGQFTKDSHIFTSPVSAFLPNNLGMNDFIGNVAEWIESFKENSSNTSKTNSLSIAKGESFVNVYNFDRTIRASDLTSKSYSYIGFRLVRSCDKSKESNENY